MKKKNLILEDSYQNMLEIEKARVYKRFLDKFWRDFWKKINRGCKK